MRKQKIEDEMWNSIFIEIRTTEGNMLEPFTHLQLDSWIDYHLMNHIYGNIIYEVPLVRELWYFITDNYVRISFKVSSELYFEHFEQLALDICGHIDGKEYEHRDYKFWN